MDFRARAARYITPNSEFVSFRAKRTDSAAEARSTRNGVPGCSLRGVLRCHLPPCHLPARVVPSAPHGALRPSWPHGGLPSVAPSRTPRRKLTVC